ncbi:MAG: nuclear transport factor 2 family protein [Alphaproteobacteria bacterium]|nr:MAG: nuclear transport factor 2 family protein [Alphaproteobacteria bacterium]
MTDAQSIAANYIATWNERNAETRAGLIARHWTASPRYADPMMSADGVAELSGMIGAVHDRFPGFVFRLINTPDGHGGYARFSWGLGPDGVEPVIEGSDVVEVEGGRIDRVIGFLDKLPAS